MQAAQQAIILQAPRLGGCRGAPYSATMMLRSLLLPGLLALAACTPPSPPDARFDGHYVGVSTRARGGGACGPETEQQTLDVRNGTFRYGVPVRTPYILAGSLMPVDVRMEASGKVDGATRYEADNPLARQGWQTSWATVEGQVAGDRIEATINSFNCGRHLTAQRG